MLRPGGRFAFTGGSARHHNTNRTDEQPPAAASLGRHLNDLFAEFAVYLPPGGSMGQPLDAAELLEEAGFVDLREDQAAVAVQFPITRRCGAGH